MIKFETAVAIIAGTIALASAIISLIKEIKTNQKNKKKELEKAKLTNHYIFTELKRYISSIDNNNVCPDDPTKNKVLKLIFKKKLESALTIFTDLAEKVDSLCTKDCEMCPQTIILTKLNNDALNDLIKSYNHFHQNGDYTPEQVKMIDYALVRFNMVHEKAVDLCLDSIDMLEGNSMYDSCTVSLQSMLFNMYLAAFIMTFSDIKKTADQINGYYKNKTW
jgi:hypothetical protein